MDNINDIPTEGMPLTKEMRENFEAYLRKHISLVASFAQALFETGMIDRDLFEFIRDNHDRSKFEEPEYTPYVKRKWFEREGDQEKYRQMGDDVKQAIVHHVTTNAHHPECWSDDYEGFETDQPCHIEGMPEQYVVEMVCDWNAMGVERGNTAREWYDKCRNTRWFFDPRTEELIDKWLKVFEVTR